MQIDLSPPSRTTIREVAQAADVSPTTVSHVLSEKRPVAPETRERVLLAIERLGFRPSGIARSLRTQRSHTVALVIPDITNPFYPVVSRGLQDGLGSVYRVLVCNTDGRADLERELVEDVVQRGVDGVVLVAFTAEPWLGEVIDRGVPLVCVGQPAEHGDVDFVESDDRGGGRAATLHLLELGHRGIGFIGGPARAGERRREGYEAALVEAGVQPDPRLIADGDWTRSGGHAAAAALLASESRPTALFCANDLMAIGALDAARELGLDVPGDVSVVGFDDLEAASLVTPKLTTVVNPGHEIGRSAGELLLERIAGGRGAPRREVTLPSPLVIRDSTQRRS